MRNESHNGQRRDEEEQTQEKHGRFLSPKTVCYIYAGLLLLATILAWAVREEHVKFFEGQRLRHGCKGHRDCLAVEGVLIISFFASFVRIVNILKNLSPCRQAICFIC